MKKMISLAALLAAAALLTACTTQESLSGSAYSRSSARQGSTVRFGTIELMEEVLIEGTGGQMSSIGGAILGAAVGSSIGGGSGKTIAMAAGGVGGAALGSAVGHKVSQRKGIEITVRYSDTQQLESIVQEPGKDVFQIGQTVRVLTEADGTKRVRPLPGVVVPAPIPAN
jgi:outer membrane lipoprotein SlyB